MVINHDLLLLIKVFRFRKLFFNLLVFIFIYYILHLKLESFSAAGVFVAVVSDKRFRSFPKRPPQDL